MPEQTDKDWSIYISNVIEAAEADGHSVWIQNDCCGCSSMNLVIGQRVIEW